MNEENVQMEGSSQEKQPAQSGQKPTIMKKFPGSRGKSKDTLLLIFGSVLVVLGGIGTGWALAGKAVGSEKTGTTSKKMQAEIKQTEQEAGVEDTSDFPSEVEGTLVEGGIEGEGTHHLEREGGPTKYVYLTSTVIDLQSFVGKRVKVWGQTLSGLHAPWLMDVGKVKVIE